MPAVAAQLDFLRQDDVERMLLAVRRSQEQIPLLPHQLAVLSVGHPRLTAGEEDDARRDQDHQTGEETQNGEADDLAASDQRIRLRRTQQQLVECVSRSWCFHSGFVLEFADVALTGRAGESRCTEARGTARVHTGSSVLTARAVH